VLNAFNYKKDFKDPEGIDDHINGYPKIYDFTVENKPKKLSIIN
jgi:hypothetical protein